MYVFKVIIPTLFGIFCFSIEIYKDMAWEDDGDLYFSNFFNKNRAPGGVIHRLVEDSRYSERYSQLKCIILETDEKIFRGQRCPICILWFN